MATRVLDQLVSLPPVPRWFAAFLLVFVLAFIVYIIFLTPLVLFGLATYSDHVGGAIGCGIGTALVNATFITFLE